MENRLKAKYESEVRPALTDKFNYTSVMAVPKIDKIVLNMGVGDATQNSKLLDEAVEELGLIAGQKPLITKAKKSIAGFRLREGMSIGAKVTLRGTRMYDFLDKLINVSLPRVRDFPEIDYDKVNHVRGLDIVIVTTANSDEEGHELLAQMGMPFAK